MTSIGLLVSSMLTLKIMHKRENLAFRQEIRFRNKLVEYVIDWIIGNHPNQPAAVHSADITTHIRHEYFFSGAFVEKSQT